MCPIQEYVDQLPQTVSVNWVRFKYLKFSVIKRLHSHLVLTEQIKNNRTPLHQTSVDTMSRSIKIFNTCVSEIQYYCPQFLCHIPILLQYLLPSSLSGYSHNINLILASLSTTVVSKPNFFGDQLRNRQVFGLYRLY